ncbi:MAG: NUDIX hydrolase [Shimia sp.]
MTKDFDGAKVALFIGDKLLVIRRDDIPTITWPDYWDFPGGGREGAEAPEETVRRETHEEVGLTLPALRGAVAYESTAGWIWFFAAHLPDGAEAGVVFGDEGQCWTLMTPNEYLAQPKIIPNQVRQLRAYLGI